MSYRKYILCLLSHLCTIDSLVFVNKSYVVHNLLNMRDYSIHIESYFKLHFVYAF